MSDEIKAPFFSYEDLRRKADEFLAQHHPDGIPVPIEEIVEFELGMDIVPTPGLHQFLEVDGFITSDLREIWVDQFVYDSRPGRYRFTLAHEVGHSILHADIFQSQAFHSVAQRHEPQHQLTTNQSFHQGRTKSCVPLTVPQRAASP